MIQIQDLKPEDVGRWVTYNKDPFEKHKGRIKTWNKEFIFVVYKCQGEWDRFLDYGAMATSPEDLDWQE